MARPTTRSARDAAKRPVSQAKAGEILKHGEVGGRPLTEKQRGFFGAIRGGAPPKNAPGRRRRR
jgi:hypothetical protein